MSTVRFAVVGCGAIHENHCRPLQEIEGAELTAVVDSDPEKLKKASEKFGVPGYSTLDEILPYVDAVTVCVPSGEHGLVGIQAARAGKHVLTEKPVEITYPAAKALVDECEKAGVKHACISQHRFAPDIQRVRDAVLGGQFGPMVQGDSYTKWYRSQAYYDSAGWRGTWALDGGGCLMNQGVHYVDMIQWVMGGVKSVQAMVRTMAHEIEVEDTAMAFVEYNSGAVGMIMGSTSVYPGFAEKIEVHGKFGTAVVEGDRLKFWEVDEEGMKSKYGRGVNAQPAPKVETVGTGSEGTGSADPAAIWGGQHRMQIEDFVRAIQNDTTPFITCRDALEPLKVILAIYESSRRGGQRVELAEIETLESVR